MLTWTELEPSPKTLLVWYYVEKQVFYCCVDIQSYILLYYLYAYTFFLKFDCVR